MGSMDKKIFLSKFDLDFSQVRENYNYRKDTHKKLVKLLKKNKNDKYINLAVGIKNISGNFSASDHHLGEPIIACNSEESIIRLAKEFYSKSYNAEDLPELIYKKMNLSYLKISIGTEMAMMLRPKKYWVGNVRTIWSHLVNKHSGNIEKANVELALYRTDNESSEMYYQKWRTIYMIMNKDLIKIEKISFELAKKQKIKPGKLKYLWIDAVCNEMYSFIHE